MRAVDLGYVVVLGEDGIRHSITFQLSTYGDAPEGIVNRLWGGYEGLSRRIITSCLLGVGDERNYHRVTPDVEADVDCVLCLMQIAELGEPEKVSSRT